MGKLKKIQNFIRYFDIFGIPIQLNFRKKNKYKSTFGAFISLIVLATAFYFLINETIAWFLVDASITINSSENFSAGSLLKENRSIEYDLNNKNYGIYFVMYAILPNSTMLSYKKLGNYFKIKYRYSFKNVIADEVDVEDGDCIFRNLDEFLNLNTDNNSYPSETDEWSFCLKTPLKLGLFADISFSAIYTPTLVLQITQCQNSTANNNSCASIKDIEEMRKYVTIQASIPKTIYDFKNQTNPIKRMYIYENYGLDLSFKKTISNEINPTFLFKDWGLFKDDYRLDSINFNQGKQTLDFNTKNSEDNVLFEYKIYNSFQIDKYYIRNRKLNDIISSFGGMFNVLHNLGDLLCININRILFMNSLINLAFRFNPHGKKNSLKIRPQKKTNSKRESFISFNCLSCFTRPFSYLGFWNKKQKIYKKSRYLLNEYIDVKKIIQRLQEIDKLKKILLNDSQRFFFDQIPKPEIVTDLDINEKHSILLNSSIVTNKINMSEQSYLENYQDLCKGYSEIDERILTSLDEEVVKKLNIKQKNDVESTISVSKNKKLEFTEQRKNIINEENKS